MSSLKSKRTLYRTRTVRSVGRIAVPIISKHFINFEVEIDESLQRKLKATRNVNSYRSIETVLDRIISKLKSDYNSQDIILLITPASRHPNLYKLHAIQLQKGEHLGMTTITHRELCRLKSSKAFHKYCIVFSSRYMDLKTLVLQTETIKGLVSTLNKKCCESSRKPLEPQLKSLTINKSNTSSAGDYLNAQKTIAGIQCQDSFIQTDPEVGENVSFTVSDILTLIDTINHTLQPSNKDIDRFFSMADKLNFSLVVRPEMLWKTSSRLNIDANNKKNGSISFQVESYLPGNCYLGCISLMEKNLLSELDLYPNLLLNIHVIQDVYEIIPLPKLLVDVLSKVCCFLKLELMYDALGEFLFDWFKNSTYL